MIPGIPSIFKRFSTHIWYVVVIPAFWLLFTLCYKPFGMYEQLSMGRGLFAFNDTIMMCIILGCLLITRLLVLYFDREHICRDWWGYVAWFVFEMVVITFFLALYVHLMDKDTEGYFSVLSTCAKYSFSILIYPYIILTLLMDIIGLSEEEPDADDSSLIKFCDANRQVKLVVKKSALLYISAEENYVRIHYIDGDKLKEYQLRATMRSIEPVTTQYGLFRCHRSYYINPAHIKALRKDRYDQISADMDQMGISIPVSRKVYADLSALI